MADVNDNKTASDEKVNKVKTTTPKVKKEKSNKARAEGAEGPNDFTHYLWLASGEVVRIKEEDVPGHFGSDVPFGHYEKAGKVYQVVGVYPRESKAEKK